MRPRVWALRPTTFAVVAAIAITLHPGVAVAQVDASERGPGDAVEFGEFLDAFMAAEMARLDVPGAALVMVRDGEVFFSNGYGFADRETAVRVDPSETVFHLGSVSKPLTALAALQQVERGNLVLDVDVNTYLDFRVADRDGTFVTLASLLTHTSGFEERRIGISTTDPEAIEPLGEFLERNQPARFAATDEVHSYTNRGYAFVGHLVEQGFGQDFASYMDDNVFEPLGMDSSSFDQPPPTEVESRLAVGYVGTSGARRAGDRMYERDYPGSGAVGTATDMAAFMIALLEQGRANGTQIVSADTAATYLAASYRPDPEVPGRTTGGLEELWINGEQAVGHAGDHLGGFAATMVLLPEHRTGLFLAYNVEVDEFRENVVTAIFDRYYPDIAPEPAFVELEDSELQRFAGTYQWTRFAHSKADKIVAMLPPYNTFVDANADGTLTVSWLDVDEKWEYRPTGPTTFARVSGDRAIIDGLILDPGAQISFTVENGKVRYLHTSLHTIAAQRVPIHLLGVVQIATYGVIVLLFIVSLVIWPVGALIRKRRGQPATTGWARGAMWLEVGVAIALTIGTAALFLGLGDNVVYGATPTLMLAVGLITIGAVAGLLLIPAAVGAWSSRWFTIGGRIYYTLLALTAPILVWWANYWNLLGFRF